MSRRSNEDVVGATAALSWEQKGCLRGILDVEAVDLAFLKVEDMPDRFVLQPVRLILQRLPRARTVESF